MILYEGCSTEKEARKLMLDFFSCFLAVKHASEAMKVVHKESEKLDSGGSIILTASGTQLSTLAFGFQTHLFQF